MAAPKNPVGSKPDKIWRNAIMLAIKRASDDGTTPHLDNLARKLIEKAGDGDITALKEIGDRLDGKAAQSVTVAGDPENPVHVQSKLDASGLTLEQLRALASIKV